MKKNILKNIFTFYYSGFKNMTWGKTLWVVILVKIFVMFGILKLFFFKDFLNSKFNNETEKSNYVIEEFTKYNK